MAALVGKIREFVSGKQEEYKPVQLEEAGESRTSLVVNARGRYTDSPDHEASVGLLSNEEADVESGEEKRVRRAKEGNFSLKSCLWCGFNMKTPLKVFVIFVVLTFIFAAYTLLAWAFNQPSPAGGKVPEFGTSLGCLSAPYAFNNTKTHTLSVPMHQDRHDHGIDFRGGAVGTVTVFSAPAGSDPHNVRYEISLLGNDQDFIQHSVIKTPKVDAAGHVYTSEVNVVTSVLPKDRPNVCGRFDVKMYIPPTLEKLHISSHSLAHIRYDKSANIKLQALYVTLYGMDANNLIQTSDNIISDQIALEVTRGWIVGDVAVVEETNVRTQRGDGNVNVHVHPQQPRDPGNPETVVLGTTTGAGKTQVVVHANNGWRRPIDASHISAMNGPVELTYKDAGINGLVGVEAKDLKETGMEELQSGEAESEDGRQWTHWVGSKTGTDRIVVSSRGWVAMYF